MEQADFRTTRRRISPPEGASRCGDDVSCRERKPPRVGQLHRCFVGAGLLFAAPLFAAAAPASDPALLFQRPSHEALELSPDGQWLAAAVTSHDQAQLAIVDVERATARIIGDTAAPRIGRIRWLGQYRLIYDFDMMINGLRFEMFAGIDVDGGRRRLLGGEYFPFTSIGCDPDYREDEYIVHTLDSDRERVLLSSSCRGPLRPSLFVVNVFNADREEIATAVGRKTSYLADRSGTVRLAVSLERDLSRRVYYREQSQSPWRIVLEVPSGRRFQPLQFEADGERVAALSDLDRDTVALFSYAPGNGERTLAFEVPGRDLQQAVYERDRSHVLGVRYYTDREHVYYLEPRLRAALAGVQPHYADASVVLESCTQSRALCIVKVSTERDPVVYYLHDLNSGALRPLLSAMEHLDAKRLVQSQPVTIDSRDGLALHGLLSLPRDAQRPAPLVIMAHDGPFEQMARGYDAPVQYLAAAGYAVLRLDFRGSAGYGRAFREAGYRQWAQSIPDDLIDAARWTIERGFADRDRIALLGHGYGGYASLVAALRAPESFAAVVAIGAIADPRLALRMDTKKAHADHRAVLARALLDPDNLDTTISPLREAARLDLPVLLAHGRRDSRIDYEHSRQLARALREAGGRVTLIEWPHEGYASASTAERVRLYERIVAFLRGADG